MTVVKYEILVKNKIYAEMCGLEIFHFRFRLVQMSSLDYFKINFCHDTVYCTADAHFELSTNINN